jgi:dynein heavy chain 2
MPPTVGDDRLSFFLTTIRSIHGVDVDVEDAEGVEVSRFLNDPEVQLLRASKLENESVVFTAKTDNADCKYISEVLFVKRSPVVLTPDTMASEVLVSTTGSNAEVESLNALLSNFYCPRLLSGDVQLPPKVQALLQDLRAATGTIVRDSGEGPDALQSFRGIVSPLHEVQFWAEYRGRDIDYDLVKALNAAFDRDRGLWRGELEAVVASEDACDWDRVGDFVDSTIDVIEAMWVATGRSGAVYPEARMAHFLDCLAGSVAQAVTRHLRLSTSSFWKGSFASLRATLRSATGLCDRWLGTVSVAKKTLWQRGSTRPWSKEAAYEDCVVGPLQARLTEIQSMRATVEELRRLLIEDERRDHGLASGGSIFRAMEDLDPLQVNAYTQPRWDKSVAAWRASLAGAETAVAANFRRSVASLHSRPDLLLREFQRFSTVLQRPAVAAELASERENLLGLLIEQLDAVESSLDSKLAEQSPSSGEASNGFGCGLSRTVSGIVLCRQTYARTATQMAEWKPLFGDLRAYGELEAMGEALLRKAKQQELEFLSDWSDEKLVELGDESEDSLRMRGQLMDIPTRGAQEGQLVVKFDERLVLLLREVRQLKELALAVPREIHDAAAQAEKFYRYGVMLKKVATYWNSLGDSIISAQRPMLLNALKAFEKMVRSRSSESGVPITWKTPGECEQYVDRLQAAAEKLNTENTSLRRSHEAVAHLVAGIMEIDLLRSKDAWKSRWTEAASIMENMRRRYPEEHMRRWLLHWDENMYKALEASYQMGLESLNENLSEIRTDVVFLQGSLQFRPGIEELRSVYYREMKKFVSIPANFPGFGNKKVYERMCNGNRESLAVVYGKAEDLFAKLSVLLEEYAPWTVLGGVDDLDAFVETHVAFTPQYEANFKMIKLKRKEAEKLPSLVKVDCVRVSLAPLKASLDDQFSRLSDALLVALRRTVLEECKDVDAFLNDAMEKLSSRPQSIDEITHAQSAWEEMDRGKAEKKALSASCLEKKRCLLQHAPGSDVDVGEVMSRCANFDGEGGRWDNFEIAMEAFNDMIEEQKETLRSVLAAQVNDLNASIERFSEKWRALQPGSSASLNLSDSKQVAGVFEDLGDWAEQLSELSAKSAGLVESSATFGMETPSFDGLAVIEAEIVATTSSWEMLREFTAALDVVADKSWIEFRMNVFELQVGRCVLRLGFDSHCLREVLCTPFFDR